MQLAVAAAIPQVDGDIRYLIDTPRVAREIRADIRRDPAMVDGCHPAYIVEASPSGRMTAVYFPGRSMDRDEWAAVRAAIRDALA